MQKGVMRINKKINKKSITNRKIRSDKKREVRPTLSIKLKNEIDRLAYILDIPIKSLGEALCYEGFRHQPVVDTLNHNIAAYRLGNNTDRVSIRFTQQNYRSIEAWASKFDVTPSRTTAVLIDSAIRNSYVIELLFQKYNKRSVIDDEIMTELKRFMKFVKKDNPYEINTWGFKLSKMVNAQRTSSIMLEPLHHKIK